MVDLEIPDLRLPDSGGVQSRTQATMFGSVTSIIKPKRFFAPHATALTA
jgi:hypothetical protein